MNSWNDIPVIIQFFPTKMDSIPLLGVLEIAMADAGAVEGLAAGAVEMLDAVGMFDR